MIRADAEGEPLTEPLDDLVPEVEPDVTPAYGWQPNFDPHNPATEKPVADDDEYEMVKHPYHYNAHPKGIECIDVIEDMSFNVGTAIKHLWRAGLKPDQPSKRDLEKAITYIEFEIKRSERTPDNPHG